MGEPIYLPTSLHVYRGRDDFEGGLCTVNRIKMGVSAGKPTYFIEIKENPDVQYNWQYLIENQEKWEKEYAGKRGRRNPDYRPEFNNDEADWVPFNNSEESIKE